MQKSHDGMKKWLEAERGLRLKIGTDLFDKYLGGKQRHINTFKALYILLVLHFFVNFVNFQFFVEQTKFSLIIFMLMIIPTPLTRMQNSTEVD